MQFHEIWLNKKLVQNEFLLRHAQGHMISTKCKWTVVGPKINLLYSLQLQIAVEDLPMAQIL